MSTLEEDKRHKGHVKFFNSTKGFGFILPDNDENIEVFVHHTAIHNDGGFKSLAEGEEVEYDLVKGPKGMQASNVTGPNGVSVKGAPRFNSRPQFPKYHRNPYNNNNNNTNNPAYYNGGYVIDPYMSQFGYGAMTSFPYYGQPPLPPNAYSQYVYNQHPQQLNYTMPPPTNYYNEQQQTIGTPPSPHSSNTSHHHDTVDA